MESLMQGNQNANILFCDGKSVQRVHFSEILGDLNAKLDAFLRIQCMGDMCIGLYMEKNVYLPALIKCLHKAGKCFIFIISANIKETTQFLKLQWIISCNLRFPLKNFQMMYQINLNYNCEYVILKNLEEATVERLSYENIFCVMMTSGTTGDNKFVRIPYHCIEDNVKSLQEKFQISSEDVIIWSTPLTFDPTLVELLLFLNAQATIVFTCEIVFLNPASLLDILVANKVTVLQMVPSIFFRWKPTEIEFLLNKSALRVLAFGGEPFPRQILAYKRNPQLKLFNLYGVTELSCWASILEVSEETYEESIPIGTPIGDTCIEIRSLEQDERVSKGIGEICLGSKTRFCLINDEVVGAKYIRTGDIAEINKNRIFYKGRKNRVVKRLGQKINLSKIEEMIIKETGLRSRSIFFNEKLCLFVLADDNFQPTTKEKIIDKLRVKLLKILLPKDFPDFIDMLLKFPLSCHGKICDRSLQELYLEQQEKSRQSYRNASNEFDNLCKSYFGMNPSIFEKYTFMELGGNSVLLTQFLSELAYNIQTDLPSDFVIILFEKPLKDCKKTLENFKNAAKRKLDEEKDKDQDDHSYEKLKEMEIVWKYDLKACVDCSPLVFEFRGSTLIAVGSFAHIFVILNEEGSEYFKYTFSDNIEANPSVSLINGFIFIGCYDGNMYCIHLEEKKISWQYQTGDKIKSRACLCRNDKAVVFGSYDNFVYCVCQKTGDLIWKLNVGGAVCSNISYCQNKLFISTLKGLCCCVGEDGGIMWRYNVKLPLFGSHCFLEDMVIWPDVTGTLHCTSLSDGTPLWKYKVAGHIFSSPVVFGNKIYIGCQDGNLYELKISDQMKHSPKILRKIKLHSEISTTPFVFKNSIGNFLVCLSNSGHFYVISTNFKKLVYEEKLPNQCFSSPVVYKGYFYVGCRDNYLYKIKFNIYK